MNHDDDENYDDNNDRKITCPEGPDTITFNRNVQQNYVRNKYFSFALRTLQQRVRTVLANEVSEGTSNLISELFLMHVSHLRPVSAAHCVNINHQPTLRARFELVSNCL
jgi:hypothetical protein